MSGVDGCEKMTLTHERAPCENEYNDIKGLKSRRAQLANYSNVSIGLEPRNVQESS